MITISGATQAVGLLRNILLYQNWGDNLSGTQSNTALIKTGAGDDSFDNPLARLSRIQIPDQDTFTDEVIRKVCTQYSLVQYTDRSGYECVKYLFEPPSDTLGYANL
jgi:hypothetical protein